MTTNGEPEPKTPVAEDETSKATTEADKEELVNVASDSEDILDGGEFVERVEDDEDEEENDVIVSEEVTSESGNKSEKPAVTSNDVASKPNKGGDVANVAKSVDKDKDNDEIILTSSTENAHDDSGDVGMDGEEEEEDFGNIKDAISNLLKAQREATKEQSTSSGGGCAGGDDAEKRGLGDGPEGGAMTEAVGNLVMELSDFLRGFSRKLGSMRSAFDMLSAQVTCLNDNIADRFTVQDAKLNCILKKMNISDAVVQNAILAQSTPLVNSSDISIVGSESSGISRKRAYGSSASIDDKVSGRGRSSAGSTPADKNSSAKTPAAKTARKRSPSPPKPKVIAFGGTDILGFTFGFQFRIGALQFNSLEQAYQYIKFTALKKPNWAAQIKASWEPDDVKNLANEFSKKISTKAIDSQEEIMMALLILKAAQCKEFAEKIKENGKDVIYAFGSGDLYWACGYYMTDNRAKQPNAWKGRNMFGKVLNEFATKLIDGTLPKDPYDLTTFCHPELKIDPTKSIAVLSDLQLTGVSGMFSTQMKVVGNLTAASNPNDLEHTALYAFKKQEEKLMSGAVGGIMLLLGTYEVGKTPEKIETDYGRLLEYLTEKTTCPIYISNALPRSDKFADQVSLANYAIRIATRKFEDKGVVLLDFYESFHKLPKWKDLMAFNGYATNRDGKEVLLELLAMEAPFANFKIQGSSGLSKAQSAPSRASPSSSSSDRGSYRGSSRGSNYRGNRARLSGSGGGRGSIPSGGSNFAPPFLDGPGNRRSGSGYGGGGSIYYDNDPSMGGGAPPGFGQFTGGVGGRY